MSSWLKSPSSSSLASSIQMPEISWMDLSFSTSSSPANKISLPFVNVMYMSPLLPRGIILIAGP